jgi:hypothetical protein
MKKNILIILLACFMASGTLAQEFKLKWGKPFSGKIFKSRFEVISLTETGICLLAPAPGFMGITNSISVIRFDAGLNYVSATKIPLKYNDKNLSFEYIARLKDHLLVMASYQDNKAGKKILYYYTFDPKGLKLSQEAVQLMDMPIQQKPLPIGGYYSFTVAGDSSHLGITYIPPQGLSGNEKFGCAVLSNDLELLYSRLDEYPFKDRDFALEDATVSPSGKLFLYGKLFSGKRSAFKATEFEYVIVRTDKDANPDLINVKLENKVLEGMQIDCNSDGNLIGAGFYSEGGLGFKGCFNVLIDGETGEVMHLNTKEFPMEIITAGMTDKEADKTELRAEKGKNIEMMNYTYDRLVTRPDGGVYLVAEQYYVVTHTYTNSNGSTTTTYTYHANNIIVVGINDQGEIDLMVPILKKQKASESGLVSYFMIADGSTLHFIFNDNAMNNAAHAPEIQYANYGKTGVTTIASVDQSGEVHRQTLYGFDKNRFYIVPSLSRSFEDGSAMMLVTFMGKCKLGLVQAE